MGENKKIAINTVVIFGKLFVVSLLGLLSARFVLQALGASDYGLYNVVGGMVVLLNVLNTSMITTTYRFLAYEMGKGEQGNPNKIFNASLAIHIGLALLFLVVGGIIGEYYISNYLNVDIGKFADARFVFRVSLVTMAVSTVFVPHQGLIVALEKFTISAIFEVVTKVIAFVGVVYLLSYSGNKLRLYSIIMMLVSFLQCGLMYFYTRIRSYSVIKIKVNRDGSIYREMFSFTGWILFGACSSVGQTQGRVMIVNYYFGTIVNAAYGIANQIENYIQLFARSLNQAAVPQITKSFSGGDQYHSKKLACYISKYTFILMTFVVFPLMIDTEFILQLWLKDVPEGTVVFCKLMMINGLLGCLGEGIPALVQATGKIKYFQIIMSSTSLMSLPIAILFFALGAPVYTILLISCGVTLINAIIRLYLLKRIVHFDIKNFVTVSYLRMVFISIPLVIAYLLYNPSSYSTSGHICGIVVSELFLLACIAILGIDNNERLIISKFIKQKIYNK